MVGTLIGYSVTPNRWAVGVISGREIVDAGVGEHGHTANPRHRLQEQLETFRDELRGGHALRKAVGLAAQELGASAEAILVEAGLVLVGHSSLKAALDLDWGQPKARAQALRLVLEEVDRWKKWLEQHQRLSADVPPMKDVMDTITQIVTQDTEPDPEGGPGASASRSMWPLTGASPLKTPTCGTVVKQRQNVQWL